MIFLLLVAKKSNQSPISEMIPKLLNNKHIIAIKLGYILITGRYNCESK